jgi:hypothetical protein
MAFQCFVCWSFFSAEKMGVNSHLEKLGKAIGIEYIPVHDLGVKGISLVSFEREELYSTLQSTCNGEHCLEIEVHPFSLLKEVSNLAKWKKTYWSQPKTYRLEEVYMGIPIIDKINALEEVYISY